MNAEPAGSGWGHRPALDGLRSVAVYLVVVFHANVGWLSGGFVGVDVFFVLSGYLVTNVLVREWSQTGRVDLRRFYARRVRRLLPAAAVTIVATAFVSTLVLSRLTRRALVGDAQSALLYVANWNFLRDATDYFAENSQQSPFLHFWSLAIEEQFYFFFPAVLIALFQLARRWPAAVVVGIGVLFASSLTAQILVGASDPLRAYYGTDTRVYQMLGGSLLAMLLTSRKLRHSGPEAPSKWWPMVTAVAFVGLILLATSVVGWSPSGRGIAGTALSVLLIVGMEFQPHGSIALVLSSSPLTYLGRISYGTYLWHWPVIVLVQPLVDLDPYRLAGLAATVATGLSAVSSRFFETPIRVAKPLDRVPLRVLTIGLSVSAVVALSVMPTVLGSTRRPVEAARNNHSIAASGVVADETQRSVPGDLDLALTEPIEIDLADCTTDNPQGCVLFEGDGLRVHLIGDSNAEMMIHALLELADDHDWTLSVNTQLGCPWQQGVVWLADDQRRIDDCVTARNDWYETYIPALDPDVIVTVGVPRDLDARSDGSVYVAEPSYASRDINESVASATADSLAVLTARTNARVLMIEPLPYAIGFDPTECLTTAATVGDCAYETSTAPLPTELTYRALASSEPDVFVADIDRIACPFLPACLPMIDGQIVFRNQLHLSDAWMVFRKRQLFEIIESTHVFDP